PASEEKNRRPAIVHIAARGVFSTAITRPAPATTASASAIRVFGSSKFMPFFRTPRDPGPRDAMTIVAARAVQERGPSAGQATNAVPTIGLPLRVAQRRSPHRTPH